MKCCRRVSLLLMLMLFAGWAWSADPPPLLTATGAVEKVDGTTLVVKPRGPDGKFGKNLALKIVGTSKVTTLMPRMQKGNVILTRKDTPVKELQAKQSIAVVYTMVKENAVLLTAVVQPPSEK